MNNVTDSIVIVHITRYPQGTKRSVACRSLSGIHTGYTFVCKYCGVESCYDCAEHTDVNQDYIYSVLCPVCGGGLLQKSVERLMHLTKKAGI